MSPVAGLEQHCAGRGGTEVVSDARVPPSEAPSPRGPSTRFLVLLVKHPCPAPRTNLDPLRDSPAPGAGERCWPGQGLYQAEEGVEQVNLPASKPLPLPHPAPASRCPSTFSSSASGCWGWRLGGGSGMSLRPEASLLSTHLRISLTGGRSQLAAFSSLSGDSQPLLSPRGCLWLITLLPASAGGLSASLRNSGIQFTLHPLVPWSPFPAPSPSSASCFGSTSLTPHLWGCPVNPPV